MEADHITSRGVIDWVFFLLSATVVWQLDLPTFFVGTARGLGARSGSPLFHFLVDIAPPALLVGIAWTAVGVYKNVLWPRLPGSNYRNGWWIYGLTAYGEEEEDPTTVVGHFYLDQDPERVRIPSGKAYIVEEDRIVEERGSWSSDTIWIDDQTLKIIFDMQAVDEQGLPESYEGLIDMDETLDDSIVGTSSYEGRFYDLDRGNMVLGQIYAERLPRRESYTRQKVSRRLNEFIAELVARSQFSDPAVPEETTETGADGNPP
jgi:hypothetical protein